MPRILILTDYRSTFYSTARTRHTLCTMDVERVCRHLSDAGLRPEVVPMAELDLAADLQGIPVLYTSSEDTGLLYKSWIEDLVLALETAGARTIPSYRFLRAHHNKVMMEALRLQLFPKEAAGLHIRTFGTLEELMSTALDGPWPKVVKSAYGAGSAYVALAADHAELIRVARRLSRVADLRTAAREHVKRALRREHHPLSLHRHKFVVQDFIPGLAGDFKVLRLGQRYYTLYRRNRAGDFRASGSGDFDFHDSGGVDRAALLDYAEQVAETIGTPLVSLDIGFDGSQFHLIEFQCLHFGTVTAEESTHYHVRDGDAWRQVQERCEIEAVFAEAIAHYLAR
ncbi:ATP-grasp domain-containing protein [Micromonospora musae]|uniref:ATP-grasp domain-containing protein n=1 Tax=Micromonospora musae TaxID=1894970 RepID=UPI0034416B38